MDIYKNSQQEWKKGALIKVSHHRTNTFKKSPKSGQALNLILKFKLNKRIKFIY